MIDITKILKRAWHILWNYRILWVFGLLLAVTTGGGGRAGSGTGTNTASPGASLNQPPFLRELSQWFELNLGPLLLRPERYIATWIEIGLGLLLLGLLVGAVFAVLRYVSEAAVIRMVNGYEETGVKAGFAQGWRMGWSRAAFRMWLIDLIIVLPPLALVLILVALGIGVYFMVRDGLTALAVIGLVASIGLGCLLLLAIIVVAILLGLLSQFFKRSAALENNGVVESLRRGWEMVRRNWQSAALMWLIMVAVAIAWALVSVVLIILLIPVFVLLILPGLIVAVFPALAALGIASLFVGSPWSWIIAVLAGAPFFLLIVGSPMLLVSGWVQIFSSSVWTLTYREVKAQGAVVPSQPESMAPGTSGGGQGALVAGGP